MSGCNPLVLGRTELLPVHLVHHEDVQQIHSDTEITQRYEEDQREVDELSSGVKEPVLPDNPSYHVDVHQYSCCSYQKGTELEERAVYYFLRSALWGALVRVIVVVAIVCAVTHLAFSYVPRCS